MVVAVALYYFSSSARIVSGVMKLKFFVFFASSFSCLNIQQTFHFDSVNVGKCVF